MRSYRNNASEFPAKFLCFDGEGISDGSGTQQRFVLFGHSEGDYIVSSDLSTAECLTFLIDARRRYFTRTFVIFAGDYDVNMMLRDLPHSRIRMLWETGKTYYRHWIIEYMPRKKLRVRDCRAKLTVTLFDVFTFFGCSFVKALEQYGAAPAETIASIKAGKDRRQTFTDSEIETFIMPYWRLELAALTDLMEKLQTSFRAADIYLRNWHGPGAVASFILKRENVKDHMKEFDNERVRYAVTNAYAGGRFEQFAMGRYRGNVYQYDIRSAYPEAIQHLPSLRNASWHAYRVNGMPKRIRPFSLYRVSDWHCGSRNGYHPQPFFWRHKNGNIIYPSSFGQGWHYGTEVLAALKYVERFGGSLSIDQCLILEHDNVKPFGFVRDIYRNRAHWKRLGNPAQYAAKIGLNSLYGKMAQRVGGSETRVPPWHQLEWAGMITAYTRAKLFNAICQNPTAIIACETDSVFSTEPLDLDIGTELGQWELTEHDEIIYLQSGVYITRDGMSANYKFRGLGANVLDWETTCKYLDTAIATREPLRFELSRFVGMGSLATGKWCQWVPIVKELQPLGYESKRIHWGKDCPCCKAKQTLLDTMHPLAPNMMPVNGPSSCHKLAWWNGGTNEPDNGNLSIHEV